MFGSQYTPPGYGGFRPQMPYYPQSATPPQQATQLPAPVQQSTVTMVTSRAQAEVAQIPFDGQPYFFMDTASRKLYCKSFDPQTGLCPLLEYAPVVQEQPPQYVTMDMFSTLAQKVEELTSMLPAADEPVRHRRAQRKEEEAE